MATKRVNTTMVQESITTTSVWPAVRRAARVLFLVVMFVLLGLIIYRGARLGWTTWQMVQTVSALRGQVRIPPSDVDMEAIDRELEQLSLELAAMETEVTPLAPVLDMARGVPEYGPLIAAAPQLISVGREAVLLAQMGADVTTPALNQLVGTEAPVTLHTALAAMAVVASDFPSLLPQIERVADALALVPATEFPVVLSKPMQQAPDLLALAELGARFGPNIPWLLGMDAPRTYLVLVQNNHELRATGGFIAAVGKVTLDKAKIVDLDFADSYEFYRNTNRYPPAPLPMQRFMGIPVLVLRDANWSPDLPTTAQVARALYSQETGTYVDGIITVDLNAVRRIVGAIQPLVVEGADKPITADNIEEQVISFWEKPIGTEDTKDNVGIGAWFQQRKDFIPAIANAALERLQEGDIDYLALAAAVQAALDERAIQAWLHNDDAQSVLADLGWDGGLHPEAGADFLAVVDTNLGYNKVDAAMERALTYKVAWPDGDDNGAIATVTLTYDHPVNGEDPTCDPTPRYGETYADMIARCYFDYVRVYAPAGSKLIGAEGLIPETVISQRAERDTQQFAGFFTLQPGYRHYVTFTYALPDGLELDGYRLILQRQSGTHPLPTTLEIDTNERYTTTLESGRLVWPPTTTAE